MNLEKFAKIFDLSLTKGLFPYELFEDIKQLEETRVWPSYKEFYSSLPSKNNDFSSELDDILKVPMIFGFEKLGSLLEFLEIPISLSKSEYDCNEVQFMTEKNREDLKQKLFISPLLFFEQKFSFESKIAAGAYSSFLDHLKYYNDMGSISAKVSRRTIEHQGQVFVSAEDYARLKYVVCTNTFVLVPYRPPRGHR